MKRPRPLHGQDDVGGLGRTNEPTNIAVSAKKTPSLGSGTLPLSKLDSQFSKRCHYSV